VKLRAATERSAGGLTAQFQPESPG